MEIKNTDLKSLLGGFGTQAESQVNVSELEKELKVQFPQAYKEILILGEELHLGPIEGRKTKGIHVNFHAISTPHFEHVSQTVREAYEELLDDNSNWDRIIPIADTGCGDQLCLDYRNSMNPLVLLYHIDMISEENPFTIEAESMDDLVSRASTPN
jgi:hypothetical protein